MSYLNIANPESKPRSK